MNPVIGGHLKQSEEVALIYLVNKVPCSGLTILSISLENPVIGGHLKRDLKIQSTHSDLKDALSDDLINKFGESSNRGHLKRDLMIQSTRSDLKDADLINKLGESSNRGSSEARSEDTIHSL